MKQWFYEVELPDDVHPPAYIEMPGWKGTVGVKDPVFYRWSNRPNDEEYSERIVEQVLNILGERLKRWLTREI